MEGSELTQKLQTVRVFVEVHEHPLETNNTTENGLTETAAAKAEGPSAQDDEAEKTGPPITVMSVEERVEDVEENTVRDTAGSNLGEDASLSQVVIDMSRPHLIEDGKYSEC